MSIIGHLLLTWIHIFTGFAIMAVFVLLIAMISKIYYLYVEKKEQGSEMDKLRRAMKINKEEIDSRL